MKIKLEQDYYDTGVKLFPNRTLNLEDMSEKPQTLQPWDESE